MSVVQGRVLKNKGGGAQSAVKHKAVQGFEALQTSFI